MGKRLSEAILDLASVGELELDELGIELVYGRAPQHRPVGVVEVAVGRIRVEELGHFDHEALEHRLEAQLARHDLCRRQQGRLLLEPLRVLLD